MRSPIAIGAVLALTVQSQAIPPSFLTSALASSEVGQVVYTDRDVQNMIDTAWHTGQTQITLPNAYVQVSKTIRIYPGMANLTLIGQANTHFVRANRIDQPMIMVGDDEERTYSNAALDIFPSFTPLPAYEGQNYIDLTNASAVAVNDWYVIAGIDPNYDTVKKTGSSTIYYTKRELVKVISKSGNRVFLDNPLGRDFTNAKFYRMQDPRSTDNPGVVSTNITLKNFWLDARIGGRAGAGTLTSPAGLVATPLIIGTTDNVTIDNLKVSGFYTSGIKLKIARNTIIKNCQVFDGMTTSMGYGVAVEASRWVTVDNCTFTKLRRGTIFQYGSMDGTVQYCSLVQAPNDDCGFDVSHGMGEKRMKMINVIAPTLIVANPMWLRGADDVEVTNCTATKALNINPGASNVVVSGKYPGQTCTAPMVQVFSEGFSDAIPAGPVHASNITFQNGNCDRSVLDGNNLQIISSSGVPTKVTNLKFKNWNFVNRVTTTGAAVKLEPIGQPSSISFENCFFSNQYFSSAPVFFSASNPGGSWDATFTNCTYSSVPPIWHNFAAEMTTNSSGVFRFYGGTFNGIPLLPLFVLNQGSGSILFP